MEELPGEDKSGARCTECGGPLAHDQRYCMQCGMRRGTLPGYVSSLIAGIRERGRRVASPGRPDEEPLVEDPGARDPWLVTPRAAAAAVLGMLGFGVLVGALVGGAGAALLRPVLLVVAPVHRAAAVVASTPSGGGGGPGGGAVSPTAPAARTITIVSGGGSQGGGGGSGGSGGGTTTTTTTGTGGSSPLKPTGTLPPVKHVWFVVLSDQGYQSTFGHSSADPYLAQTLVKRGLLIPFYYAVAGGPLANEIALVSGQGPTSDTVDNCPDYLKITPGNTGANHQVLGQGCAYPKKAKTLGDELTALHQSWKVYVQVGAAGKQGKLSAKETKSATKQARLETCTPKAGAKLKTNSVYAAWRNPFLYFQSTTGKSACPKQNVSLDKLSTDLKHADTTPVLSYIVPDLCDDGGSTPCAPHAPSGMAAADAFLKSVVPEIERSAAYKADGLIAITFDNAPQSGLGADSSSCCSTPTYPNLPSPTGTGTTTSTTPPTTTTSTTTTTTPTTTTSTTTTTTTTTTATTTTPTTTTTPPVTCYPGSLTCPTGGGGQVGLLLISPYVAAGTQDPIDYFNHFSLLASVEGMFGIQRLGYTCDPTVLSFSPGVFRNWFGTGGVPKPC